MIPIIFDLLSAGLNIWQDKEKRKYVDQLIRLRTEWYNEINKPDNEIDDNVLSDIEYRIKLLCRTFTAAAGISSAKNQP